MYRYSLLLEPSSGQDMILRIGSLDDFQGQVKQGAAALLSFCVGDFVRQPYPFVR
jgi:hypothetical protein